MFAEGPGVDIGPKHADDLRRSIELAGLLGVRTVVTRSGTPGSDAGTTSGSAIVATTGSNFGSGFEATATIVGFVRTTSPGRFGKLANSPGLGTLGSMVSVGVTAPEM